VSAIYYSVFPNEDEIRIYRDEKTFLEVMKDEDPTICGCVTEDMHPEIVAEFKDEEVACVGIHTRQIIEVQPLLWATIRHLFTARPVMPKRLQ
jgi:hypothetical protein